MSLFDNFDIKDLAKILKNPDPNDGSGSSDTDEAETQGSSTKTNSTRVLGPSDIGKKKEGSKDNESSASEITENKTTSASSCSNSNSNVASDLVAKKENKSNIWSQHELTESGGDGRNVGPDVSLDPRTVPVYDMYFSQSVTPEDAYLQMGHKTPATSSCENLIVKISLPGEDHNSMQLELKEQRVELRSPNYILSLPTPHPIDPRGGNAKWNADTETLVLTLKLDRNLDMLNF